MGHGAGLGPFRPPANASPTIPIRVVARDDGKNVVRTAARFPSVKRRLANARHPFVERQLSRRDCGILATRLCCARTRIGGSRLHPLMIGLHVRRRIEQRGIRSEIQHMAHENIGA